jgi:hypothetical protein
MGRKNFNTKHGRRRQAKPPVTVTETDTISLGEMARRLVDRGLASGAILDGGLKPENPARPHEMEK